MQTKQGFLLIELVIGMAIAMAITLMLINVLHQTQKARATLDDYVYVYTQAAIINHQLERDLITAFAPDIILVPIEKNLAEKSTVEKSTVEKSAENSENEDTSENKKTEKQKDFEKPFYATEKDKNLSLLTCITTSPLSTYWSSQSGPLKVRMARVIYQLKKDPLDTNAKNSPPSDSYTLYRKEGQNLDFKAYSSDATTSLSANNTHANSTGTTRQDKIHQYPIVKNIKSCAVTYEVVIEQQDSTQEKSTPENKTENKMGENKKQDNNNNQQKREYKTFTNWDQEKKSDQKSESKKETEKELPRLPHSVTVNLVLWNRKRSREFPFTFTYSIVWRDGRKKA